MHSTLEAREKEIVDISIVPYNAPEKIIALHEPMVDYLNKHSKYQYKLKLFQSHEKIVDGICNNETSIAMLGPAMAAVANNKCKVEPILMALGLEKKPYFNIIIITADNKIKSLQDLKGKTVGIFKVNTSTYAKTKKMIHDEGIPLSTIKFVIYPKLEDIVLDVLAGKIDAGGIRESTIYNFKYLNLKIIKKSENNPGFAYFAKPGLNKEVIKDFQKIMTTLNVHKNPKTLKITEKWDPEIANGFILPSKEYLKESIEFYNSTKDFYK